MRTILAVTALALVFAACDSPTAPHALADGSVHFSALNPQPLPPGLRLSTHSLNPQPLPPGLRASASVPGSGRAATSACFATRLFQPPDPCSTGFASATTDLNPQPLPPGLRASASLPGSGRATTYACFTTRLYEPPDPCLK